MAERFGLTRWSPFRELSLWDREMDRFFGHTGRWFDWPVYTWRRPLALGREYFAPMEVLERDGQTVVKLELPGMESEDIDISLADGVLTIKGEKKHEEEVTEGDYYRSERTYGSFRRTLAVPTGIDEGKITATYYYPTCGKEAIQIAADILAGKKVEKDISLGTIEITQENAEENMHLGF